VVEEIVELTLIEKTSTKVCPKYGQLKRSEKEVIYVVELSESLERMCNSIKKSVSIKQR